MLTTDNNQIIFSDASNNVYIGEMGETVKNVKVIKAREQNTLVYHLNFKDDLITIILSHLTEF